MNSSYNPSRWERWADFTVRYDRIIVGMVLVITLFFAYFLFRLEVGTDIKSFYRKDSRELTDFIEQNFEEGKHAIIVFESQSDKSLLSPELLREQYRVLQEIKQRYKITTFSLVDGIDEGLRRTRNKSLLDIDDYTPIAMAILALSGPKTVRDLESVSQHFLSHPEAISFYSKLRIAARFPGIPAFASSDLKFSIPYVKASQAFLQLDPSYTWRQRRAILAELRDWSNALALSELKVFYVGTDLNSYDIDRRVLGNALFMGLILVVVDSLLLWLIFRSRREVFLTLFIMTSACIWTFGAIGLIGLRTNFFHTIVLPILLGTGIDDSVVFGRRLAEEIRRGRARGKGFREALRSTFAATGNGIFLTTFTTCMAFGCGALLTSSQAILSFYLTVSISMVAVFVLTVLLQGSMRSLLTKRERRRESATVPPSPRLLAGLATLSARWITTRPRTILLVGGLLLLFGLGLASRLETDFNPQIFLRRDMPSYTAYQVRKRYFDRIAPGYILLSGEVENPELLQKIKLLEDRMNRYPLIKKVLNRAHVISVNELIDKMRLRINPQTSVREVLDQVTSSEKTANFVLNETYQEVARHRVHKSGDQYDALLMKFFVEGEDVAEVWSLSEALKSEMKSIGIDGMSGLRTRIGGGTFGAYLEQRYFFGNFIQSFFLSLAVNCLVLIILWRRFRYPLLATLPLIFSVGLIVGLMPLFGAKLHVLNLSIGIIVVGLGIDFPIHLIERYNEERKGGAIPPPQAMQTVLSSMGPTLFGSVLTTIFGFAAAVVLAMPVAESFGLFTAAAIFLAYLATIFVLPVLLVGRVHE